MAIQFIPAHPHAEAMPAEPELTPQTYSDVFVHHTIPGYEENHRLAALGQRMLRAAYWAALFKVHPELHGAHYEVRLPPRPC